MDIKILQKSTCTGTALRDVHVVAIVPGLSVDINTIPADIYVGTSAEKALA